MLNYRASTFSLPPVNELDEEILFMAEEIEVLIRLKVVDLTFFSF